MSDTNNNNIKDELEIEDIEIDEIEVPDSSSLKSLLGISEQESPQVHVELDEYEIEVDIDEGNEFDEIAIGDESNSQVIVEEQSNTEIPNNYLFVENLVMIGQVAGLLEERNPELVIVDVYAMKNDKLTLVGPVELTSDNISRMQLLGLKVTLERKTKGPIYFDKAEDYVAIVKTLREVDTVDYEPVDIHGDISWVERR